MKKRFFVTYLIFLHLFVGLVLVKSNFISRVETKINRMTTNPPTLRHAAASIPRIKAKSSSMLSYHKRMDGNVPNGAVIFIGDSITQGLCVSAVVPLSVNYGIGGDTSDGVLKRLPEYKSLDRASVIVIAIGVNDMGRSRNEDILTNYRAIIQNIPEKVPVVFSAVLPIDQNGKKHLPRRNQRIRRLNEELKKLCATSARLFFVDAGPLLIDKDGNISDEFQDGDNIHLNSMGNSIWIRELKKTIRNAQQTCAKTECLTFHTRQ